MFGSKRLARHEALITGMTLKLGVEQVAADQLSPEEWRGAVLRCSTCSDPEACTGFLAEPGSAGAAPDYCRNHDLMARLAENPQTDAT